MPDRTYKKQPIYAIKHNGQILWDTLSSSKENCMNERNASWWFANSSGVMVVHLDIVEVQP